MAKLGPVDDFADIWCKLMRLRTQCQRFKNEGIIGPQLQSQCDQLASDLEKISDAPNSSKLFQCMVDATLAYALQIVAQVSDLSPSSTADNSSTKDANPFTTPTNMSPSESPGVAKTLEWSPATTKISRGAPTGQGGPVRKRPRKSDQGTFVERRNRYVPFALNLIKTAFRKENERRIQAQQPLISPTEIASLIRRGKELGISRPCLGHATYKFIQPETKRQT